MSARGNLTGCSSVSHLIHGGFFAIGEMSDMDKITDLFIALGVVLLVGVVVALVI